MGLHPDPRRAAERRPSGQPVLDRPDPEGARDAARAGAADVVADLSAGALGRDRRDGFFTMEVWRWRGLVTYYTVFVIDLASRRVQIVGSTPHQSRMSVSAGLSRSANVICAGRSRKTSSITTASALIRERLVQLGRGAESAAWGM